MSQSESAPKKGVAGSSRPMDFDALGDMMKKYEAAESERAALDGLPVVVRLDGRTFHTYTRGMLRPFDWRMQAAMVHAASVLVDDLHPAVAYTQSDEITLIWTRAVPFGGRFQKLASVGASVAAAAFNSWWYVNRYGGYRGQIAAFDGRAWQVPNREIALDVLAWREYDAVKNSVSMAASSVYSHRELHGKGRADQMDMLHAKGINWNDYPAHFKRGVYLQRVTHERTLTDEERARIPEGHRPPPDATFLRSKVEVLEMEPIRRVPAALDLLLPLPATGALPVPEGSSKP